MAKQQDYQAPKRKEPGLIGKLFSALIQFISWLIVSLIISIGIEWVGMSYYWTDQGANHAKEVLAIDKSYMNLQLVSQSLEIKVRVVDLTFNAVSWIEDKQWLKSIGTLSHDSAPTMYSGVLNWVDHLLVKYSEHIEASKYVSQTFVIRLGLIVFSLPIFGLAILVGAVDGLVERDLRRWGGGRESSNVFKLAKKTITPLFVLACVVYISVPISINPVFIILPFAGLVGLSVRITFERLKKYF